MIKGLARATHAGVLKLGALGIPCSVLDNDLRVFSISGLHDAFGSRAKGRSAADEATPPLPPFLSAANVRAFISPELMHQLANPVSYRALTGGRPAIGYEATILRKMCDVLLDARAAGVLRLTQLPVARAAESLVRAFADVGIIALIDEATGFQYDRASHELRRLLEAYVVEDMRPWAKLFPDVFFRQIYRIHGWQYKPGVTQARLPPGCEHPIHQAQPRPAVLRRRSRARLHRWTTWRVRVAARRPPARRLRVGVRTLMPALHGRPGGASQPEPLRLRNRQAVAPPQSPCARCLRSCRAWTSAPPTEARQGEEAGDQRHHPARRGSL